MPGLKICHVDLRFRGNDVGSIMIEETWSQRLTLTTAPAKKNSADPSGMLLYSQATRYVISDVFFELISTNSSREVVRKIRRET